LALCLFMSTESSLLAQEGEKEVFVVLIGGLGGSEEYTERFQNYLFESRKALAENFDVAQENMVVLGEAGIAEEEFVDQISTAENIRSSFSTLKGKIQSDDHLYVFFFGHGSYDGEEAYLNIPRRDLSAKDYDGLLSGIDAGRIFVFNTASASAPFIEELSAPGRVIVTATRRGTQRNETIFPQYLVEALSSSASDLDKNGQTSVRELFVYAAEQTARHYESNQNLATEHALLEDTGDGKGHRVLELEAEAEGNLAASSYLSRNTKALAGLNAADRERASQQLSRKDELEQLVATIKSQKSTMSLEDYYDRLEVVFVELARLNEDLEGAR